MSDSSVTVSAAANIALVKYWGKAQATGNQPATASLSIGLENLRTTTTVTFSDKDHIHGELDDKGVTRLAAFVDVFRNQFGIDQAIAITTANNFPTASGLASSASGFAAITLALDHLFDLKLSGLEKSQMARQGSGSAARSVYGGYVEVVPGGDAHAGQIMPAENWPLDVIVAVTQEAGKFMGSTEAMKHTAATSPLYQAWLKTHENDMNIAKQALGNKDFEALANISEHNCLKMHSTMMTSRPPVLYWKSATVAIMHLTQHLRAGGTRVFFTIDAGAQVKLICDPADTQTVYNALEPMEGISRLIQTRVGGEPHIR